MNILSKIFKKIRNSPKLSQAEIANEKAILRHLNSLPPAPHNPVDDTKWDAYFVRLANVCVKAQYEIRIREEALQMKKFHPLPSRIKEKLLNDISWYKARLAQNLETIAEAS